MAVMDVNKEQFQEVEIKGHYGVFTELRVDKSTIPEGVNCYEFCHGDDDSYPAALEESVRVNYFGAVLMTDKMDLGQEGYVPLAYEDFGFTGENKMLKDFIEEQKNVNKDACISFHKGSELMQFLKVSDSKLEMTEQEAATLLEYMDGHAVVLGYMGNELMCMDLCEAAESQIWKPYTMDDAINTACDCNYDMISQAEMEQKHAGSFAEYEQVTDRLGSLRADEKILDALFERTKYGREIESLAQKLADECISDMQSKEGIDGAIRKMTEQIEKGMDLLPDVSPALKKDGGKAR